MLKKILLIFIFLSSLFGQSKKYYFYDPSIDYGSESTFNPVTLWFNGSYDILRNGAHTRNIFKQPYKQGYSNVFQNIFHPRKNLDIYGWDNFFRREFLNFEFDVNESQFLPNVGLHTIGNGMQYMKLAEYYDYHNYPAPHLLSLISLLSFQITNESVENATFSGANADPISDLLIFNPIGYLIFSLKPAKIFFSEKVPLYNWYLQPMIDPMSGTLYNMGQQWATKIKIFPNSKRSFFINFGISNVFGISQELENDYNISVGLGAIVTKLKEYRKPKSRYVGPGQIDYAMGVYFDRKNSVLASALITGPNFYNIKFNMYPGLINFKGIKPGLFIGCGEADGFQFGISLSKFPLGLGTNFLN